MKILVIENDQGFRDAWSELLRSYGNTVFPIPTLQGQKAGDLSSTYDLALIDRRALDDEDQFDITGQDFAVELCKLGTPTVLVTGFLPADSVLFDLLRTGSVSAIADKSMDMAELAQCVEEFKVSHRFPNCVARFKWKKQPENAFTAEDWETVRRSVAAAKDISGGDLAVLFRSLIPACARSVILDPITPGHSSAALFRAKVSSGDGPVVEDVAIKYGERTPIVSEAVRYDRHVGPLPDGVAAHLRWRKETRKLGAIAYSWVGDSVEDGVPFGPIKGTSTSLNWRRRRNALERLFSISLNPWFQVYRSEAGMLDASIKLIDYYISELAYSKEVPFAKEQQLPRNIPSAVMVEAGTWNFGEHGRLIDPVDWLTNGRGSALKMSRHCPGHGDLHVKNIFVMPDDSPRLIDFGDTALGHVFRDFAALEASVRLTCCNTTDLAALKRATDCASSTEGLGEYIDYRSIPDTPIDLKETLITTMLIRRAALDAVGDHPPDVSFREYLFAVTLRMLRYATGISDEFSSDEDPFEKNTRVWHALYGAASAAQQAMNK